MISVQEHPIQCVNGKCILMSKKMLPYHTNSNEYEEIYGKNDSHRRFENLGLPIFVVQNKCDFHDVIQENNSNIENETISDELFDKLFDKVEKKSKSRSKTRKLRKKSNKKEKKETK